MKDSGLYDNAQYADSAREIRNTKAPDVKPPEKEKPVEGVSQADAVVNGGAKSIAENGYTNGAKENAYSNGSKENGQSNGEKKKGGLFKRLSLQR